MKNTIKQSVKRIGICLVILVFMGQNLLPIMAGIGVNSEIGQAMHRIKKEIATSSEATPSEATPFAATPSAAGEIALLDSATGDLWKHWNGDMDFAGSGTKSDPYRISSLSELMGLSEIVASGTSFAGEYLELTGDLDLGGLQIQDGNWNPIGWYQNQSDLSGAVRHPFRGHFDGLGHTISSLKIISSTRNLQNVGLFGVLDGGSVHNLTVAADTISGGENVAVLAGAIKGNAEIHEVMVSGFVSSDGNAGGIAGEITGGSQHATIENCSADGMVINSENKTGYVGGIAGNVQKADLVDNVVRTYDGDSNRIQGKGYVGGIAGRMNLSNLYNSYVSGTIGGNGTAAVGGIVGKYESGNLILARFAGDISRTNHGSAAREGTFVGTRESRHNFSYGTEKSSNLAYLFTVNGAMAKQVFGSNIDGDNRFPRTAHIGYWTDHEKKYKTVSGSTETGSGDRYFYEELEAAVKYIMTQKLDQAFTVNAIAKNSLFRLDHFAPGYQGEPMKGYLVSIPRIDVKNAGGTYDTDVAALTALPSGNNSYYRPIDQDHPSAVASGVTVTVVTAPKNTDGNRYQMVYDESEPGKVQPPTYLNDFGDPIPMAYIAGGRYSFEMPSCDTELNAGYVKVTTKLTMTPAETALCVTHTRSGDRKNPSIITEVKNAEGILIARYLDGTADTAIQVQPIRIHAEQNNTGSTSDKRVKWFVDDPDLLINSSEIGYTDKDGMVIVNPSSAFIQSILTKEVQAQVNDRYQSKIANTIYTKSAVVTASANPVTSADHQAVYGNTKINVTFQILDHTTVRVEGLVLNKGNHRYMVTRKLTGDRRNPQETITCSAPAILTATLNPAQPFFKNVSWSDRENGKMIMLIPRGANTRDCSVSVQYDPVGKDNPAWIQNVINEDNSKKAANDGSLKLSGTAIQTERVTAVSEDQTHGNLSAFCDVIIDFVTVDETVIYPESITLDQKAVTYDLTLTKTGRRAAPVLTWSGQEPKTIHAVIRAAEALTPIYESSESTLLAIAEDGSITPNLAAPWIQEVIAKKPYKASKEVLLRARTPDKTMADTCKAAVNVMVIDQTYSDGGTSGGGIGGVGGSVTGTWIQNADGRWIFNSGGRTYSSEWAYIHNPYAAQGQKKTDWFYFTESGDMMTGWYTDAKGSTYYLNPVSDNTLGRMFTGWNWIGGQCYYFAAALDGREGVLLKDTKTPDGFFVDKQGIWIEKYLENER